MRIDFYQGLHPYPAHREALPEPMLLETVGLNYTACLGQKLSRAVRRGSWPEERGDKVVSALDNTQDDSIH